MILLHVPIDWDLENPTSLNVSCMCWSISFIITMCAHAWTWKKIMNMVSLWGKVKNPLTVNLICFSIGAML